MSRTKAEAAANPRDPRVDPRPGDVTREMDDVILVVRVKGGIVWYAASGQRSDELYSMAVDEWEKCCRKDKVIHAAD